MLDNPELPRNNERIPFDPLRVGISISAKWGGWGDIEHGVKIADRIHLSPSRFKMYVYTPDFATAILSRIPKDMDVITYRRGVPSEGEFHYLRGVVPEDVMISVCGAPVPSQEVLPGVRIYVEEFSVPPDDCNLQKKHFWISTGFSFHPNKKGTIQAGIPFSSKYEALLDRRIKNKREVLAEVEQTLSEQVGRRVHLDGQRVGLYYMSDIKTNYSYFDLLWQAAMHIREPITIIAPVVNREFDPDKEQNFEKQILHWGFNYTSQGRHINNGSNVTIINPHRLPPERFLSIQALADVPIVVTGDQSLAEAVQKSQSEAAVPFLYYCHSGTKGDDYLRLIQRIDPYVAQLAASYFILEIPHGQNIFDAEGNNIRDKYKTVRMSEIEKLFYDQGLIKRFNDVMKRIPKQMLLDRKPFVDDAEKLVDVTATIEELLDAIRTNDTDRISRLMVKGRRGFLR